MASRKNKIDELEKALFRAHRNREKIPTSETWRKAVMSDIRNLGALRKEYVSLDLFGVLAWRFSAAACFAALILLVYIFATGFIDYHELAMQFLEDPLSYIL